MRTYLFDASATVEIYLPSRSKTSKVVKALEFILEQKTVHHAAALLIPNICIAEVFNALAKRYSSESIPRSEYVKSVRDFRKDIHWARTLYPYDLNRYHVVAADRIIAVEHHVPSLSERDHLSTFDILVIAMACELAFIGQPEDTFLITCDQRIKRVFEELKKTSAKQISEWLDSIELDYPWDRWRPPQCILLQRIAPNELTPVAGQALFNV